MSPNPQTRAEAERDIENLYGWPEEYGPIENASDERVISVAHQQIGVDDANAQRPYTAKQMSWRP